MQIRDNYTPDGKILPLPHNHMCRHELALPEKKKTLWEKEKMLVTCSFPFTTIFSTIVRKAHHFITLSICNP